MAAILMLLAHSFVIQTRQQIWRLACASSVLAASDSNCQMLPPSVEAVVDLMAYCGVSHAAGPVVHHQVQLFDVTSLGKAFVSSFNHCICDLTWRAELSAHIIELPTSMPSLPLASMWSLFALCIP